MMDASGFIASRIRFKGKLAAWAIAISFLVMIIAVAVSSGFRREIRAGVSKVSGDVILSGSSFNFLTEDDPVRTDSAYVKDILAVKGVTSITPAIYRAGIVKTEDDIQGILVKGVPSSDSTLSARIPGRLASALKLRPGDAMVTYFVGERIKVRKFKVIEIYDSMVEADGNLIVYVPIDDLQRLNGWDAGCASVLEVRVDDNFKDRNSLRQAATKIGMSCPLLSTSASDRYSQLFDWLDLIDFNVLAILLLMTIVAGFNMISGLLILLFRHISTIGTLKALGMSNSGVAKVFFRVSARIVLTGMLAGNILGFLFCFIQDRTHIIRLNPENYFVSFVPVDIDIPAVIAADVLAFAVILLFTLLPCMFISRVDPSETARTE